MENLKNQRSASNIKPLDRKLITSENQDEDICAICMGSYENMSHPNECFHKYCFGCLEEWSKIKPECPLCLKKITSIQIDGTSEKYSLMAEENSTNDDFARNFWTHAIIVTIAIMFNMFAIMILEILTQNGFQIDGTSEKYSLPHASKNVVNWPTVHTPIEDGSTIFLGDCLLIEFSAGGVHIHPL